MAIRLIGNAAHGLFYAVGLAILLLSLALDLAVNPHTAGVLSLLAP